MIPDPLIPTEESSSDQEHKLVRGFPRNNLLHTRKNIIIDDIIPRDIDDKMVTFDYYNCFNYSLLRTDQQNVNLTVGITSSNRGEGKTLVACNLAVSLAMGYERETVLIDLNIEKPRLHEVFGTKLGPGLMDALQNGSIHISKTNINHLCILSAGTQNGHQKNSRPASSLFFNRTRKEPMVGLKQLAAFRDIIHSLEEQYEFVIVDMPALQTRGFPILYSNELNGLLVVIDTKKTRREDIDKMLRLVHERQILGFVFNRFVEED